MSEKIMKESRLNQNIRQDAEGRFAGLRALNSIERSGEEEELFAEILSPLDAAAIGAPHFPHFYRETAGRFQIGGRHFEIPRYRFSKNKTNVLRIGLFALIHGDEPAGARALTELPRWLFEHAALLEDYEILIYPICNPVGYLAGSRFGSSGDDINREFWQDSTLPEVRILERELEKEHFDGLISLHSDDTSPGIYGFVRGAMLAEALLEPALAASENILARNLSQKIDGFKAYHGIIYSGYPGTLSSRQSKPQPFEIVFETPGLEDEARQVDASLVAIQTILLRYREFISYASNI